MGSEMCIRDRNMVARVLRFSVPAGLIATLCSFGSYWVGQTFLSTTLAEDRTTATIALIIVGLGVLIAVASPLVPWKVALIAAMAGLFMLCLTVPWARRYLALDPGEVIDTAITVAVSLLGAVAVIVIGHHTIPKPGAVGATTHSRDGLPSVPDRSVRAW